jgi:hypothetical protein
VGAGRVLVRFFVIAGLVVVGGFVVGAGGFFLTMGAVRWGISCDRIVRCGRC